MTANPSAGVQNCYLPDNTNLDPRINTTPWWSPDRATNLDIYIRLAWKANYAKSINMPMFGYLTFTKLHSFILCHLAGSRVGDPQCGALQNHSMGPCQVSNYLLCRNLCLPRQKAASNLKLPTKVLKINLFSFFTYFWSLPKHTISRWLGTTYKTRKNCKKTNKRSCWLDLNLSTRD